MFIVLPVDIEDVGLHNCNKCNIGTHLKPYIGSEAKYVLVSESPVSAATLLTPDKSDF
jgi:hypothetical protein